MLTPDKLEKLSYILQALAEQIQSWTIRDIARRIAETGVLTASAEYQLNRLMQIRTFDIEYKKEIARLTGMSQRALEKILEDAAATSLGYDKRLYSPEGIPYIPYMQNEYMQELTQTVINTTNEEMQNITRTMGFAEKVNGKIKFKPIAKFFQDELDTTVMKIETGVQDYSSAIRQSVKKMVNSGLRTVDYASGRSNRIEVAVRRAVLTGLKKITHEQAKQQAQRLGVTTHEITYHSGHRPSHGWGGRRYTTKRIPDIDSQTGKPFMLKEELFEKYGGGTLDDCNCYHDVFCIYPDDPPIYSLTKLEQLEREEEEVIKYDNKNYNKYDAKQQQRKLEVKMRKARLEASTYETAGLVEDALFAKARYTKLRQEYKKFSEAMGLHTEFERVYYDSLGRVYGKLPKTK